MVVKFCAMFFTLLIVGCDGCALHPQRCEERGIVQVTQFLEVAAVKQDQRRPAVDATRVSMNPTFRPAVIASSAEQSIPLVERLAKDQFQYYSRDSTISLGLALGAGSILANTDLDSQIQEHFQASVRGAASDEWFEFLHANKELGNGRYTLPIMGAVWMLDESIDGPPIVHLAGTWGEQSIRAFLVGAPPLIVIQRMTGGSRPGESDTGSNWHPFRDDNGISGHAFMASFPFLTAGAMTDDPWKKSFWYASSAIGPLSRVNDNAHYPSQIMLGWSIAYLATMAVQRTNTASREWVVVPELVPDGGGVVFVYRW